MISRSIRVRLTLWNATLLGALLLGSAAAAYQFLRHATQAQLDRGLRQEADRIGLMIRQHPGFSGASPAAAIAGELREWRSGGVHATVLDPGSRDLSDAPVRPGWEDHEAQEAGERNRGAMDSIAVARVRTGEVGRLFTLDGAAGGLRVVSAPLLLGERHYTVIVTQSLSETKELLERAGAAILVSLPLLLLVAIAGGYLMARQALAPVAAMGQQAQEIGAHNLHQRLAVIDPNDELGQLGASFNALLERVNHAFDQQRRFTADASHELRTPLAIVRGEAELALESRRSVEEYREALRIIRDSSERLSRIVNDLFLLARADAGQVPVRMAPLRLDELIRDLVRSVRTLARNAGIEVRASVAEEPAPVAGDEDLLRRLFLNLLDNAIKYSHRPGNVIVTLERAGAAYCVTIADSGSGIALDAQDHIFERFYRGDAARQTLDSAHGGGAGLGLSIARWIAEQHGGRVRLVRSGAEGSVFEVVLPARPAADPEVVPAEPAGRRAIPVTTEVRG